MPNLTDEFQPLSGMFSQPVWNHLLHTQEVICLTDPRAVPPKEGDLVPNSLFFANSLFACSYLLIKVFHFAQLFRALFYLLSGMLPNS